MKRLSMKQLMVVVFAGLMMSAGATYGETPPGAGEMVNADNEIGQGTQDRARDHSCDDLTGVFGTHDGPGCGDGNQWKHGLEDVSLDGEGACGGGCDHNEYMWKGTK